MTTPTTNKEPIYVSLSRKDGSNTAEILQLKMDETALHLFESDRPKYTIHWKAVRNLTKGKHSVKIKFLFKSCFVMRPAISTSVGTLFSSMLLHLRDAQQEKQRLLDIMDKEAPPSQNFEEEELEKTLLVQNVKKPGLHLISVDTPSLPRNIPAPITVSSEEAHEAAKYRKRKRLVVPVYSNGTNFILRGAAPKLSLRGLLGQKEPKYVKAFIDDEKVKTVELRPSMLLVLDMMAGNWTEKAMLPYFSNTEFCQRGLLGKNGTRKLFDKWVNGLDSNSYISFCDSALNAALNVADSFKSGRHVLVHCSDGWDRTAIVISLALIIMDSTQRDSIETFMKKILYLQWFSFGHPFSVRLGHRYVKHDRMPIFAIFMDILHSLVKQNPGQFGFTSKFIRFLAEEAYNMKYSDMWITKNRDERGTLGISYDHFVNDVATVAQADTYSFDRGSYEGSTLKRIAFRKEDSVEFWEKFGLSEVATEWEAVKQNQLEQARTLRMMYSSPPKSLIPADEQLSSPYTATTITIPASSSS